MPENTNNKQGWFDSGLMPWRNPAKPRNEVRTNAHDREVLGTKGSKINTGYNEPVNRPLEGIRYTEER